MRNNHPHFTIEYYNTRIQQLLFHRLRIYLVVESGNIAVTIHLISSTDKTLKNGQRVMHGSMAHAPDDMYIYILQSQTKKTLRWFITK